MKKYIALVLLSVFVISCKSKAVAVQNTDKTVEAPKEDKKAIAKHYDNKLDFKTLNIKASAKYEDEKQSQNVTAEIKIEKDKQILVSVRFLGITMAKALITPTTVSYYEKIKGTYYEGDFTSLSKWLGTELDYSKVQNLLVGEALDDLRKGKYTQTIVENLFKLEDEKEAKIKKSFYLDSEKYLIQKEEISQPAENRMLAIKYSESKTFDQGTLPTKIEINAVQPKGKTDINLEYNNITFNEELSFPYSVPGGYKKVIIN
jgi:Flp pilus assembly secretin CpaC